MNPVPAVEDGELAYKDAVFISPHKLPGGPGTPGVLVAKRHLFANEVPAVPGGGTVEYVTDRSQAYLADPAHREEGGTPAIVESIRAGLAFALREEVGAETIAELEEDIVRRALASWTADPRLVVAGNPELERVAIVSLGVPHPLPGRPGAMLHPGFIVALLDDLFGIQARSGCFCAAPYVHRLAGIDAETAAALERETVRGGGGIRPGLVRLAFAYFTGRPAPLSRRRRPLRRRAGWKPCPSTASTPLPASGAIPTGRRSRAAVSSGSTSTAAPSARRLRRPCSRPSSRRLGASSPASRRGRRPPTSRRSGSRPSSSGYAGSRCPPRLSRS